MLARLNGSGSVLNIQDAHHNKMLMDDTKHCADRISIRGLLTVRERNGWMLKRLNPTCLTHNFGGGLPLEVQYLHLLDHISAPQGEALRLCGMMKQHGWKECKLRPDSSRRPYSASLKHS